MKNRYPPKEDSIHYCLALKQQDNKVSETLIMHEHNTKIKSKELV